MYDAPSPARNAIACATSSAVPDRPTGVAAPITRSRSEADEVSIHPGATAFTVMPAAAVSIAVARVSPTMPAFAAW
jgi:hypothetical protein